jgi:hypothetical protein
MAARRSEDSGVTRYNGKWFDLLSLARFLLALTTPEHHASTPVPLRATCALQKEPKTACKLRCLHQQPALGNTSFSAAASAA